MLDGVQLNGLSNGSALVTLPNFDLGTLSNIELIKGPASALYGSDAFNGTLALTTFAPSPGRPHTHEVDAEFGSDNYYQVAGRMQSPINDTAFVSSALAVSGQGNQKSIYQYTDPDSQQISYGSRANSYDSLSGFVKFGSDTEAPRNVNVGVYWNSFEADRFPGPGRSQSPGQSRLRDRDWSGSDTEFIMTRATVNQKLSNDMTVELKAFAWQADVDQYTNVPGNNGIGENQSTVSDVRYGGQVILRGDTGETQWAVAAGHDSLRVKDAHFTSFAADGSIVAEGEQPTKGETRKIQSLLGEAKTQVLDGRLRIVYGTRIDHYDDFGTQANPRLALIFQSSPQWTLKMLYGRAFRAPAAFELRGIGGFKGNPGLDPEIIDTVEWVAINTMDTGYLTFTLFHSKWRDAIVTVPINDPDYRLEFVNAEKNASTGVEATYHFQRNAWWTDTNISYVKSTNESLDRDYTAFPQVMLNLGLGYKSRKYAWNFFLNNRVLLEMAEGANRTLDPQNELPTYWRVDLNAEKQLSDQLRVAINVRNLLDKENRLPSLFLAENGVPDDALSVSAEVMYKF